MVVRVRRDDEEDIERCFEEEYDTVLVDRKDSLGIEMVGIDHIGSHHDQMDY